MGDFVYNPFNKDISEIKYEDLEKLIENEVSEGWFIEYKSSFPNKKKNQKVAKSIASFANSNGGWYIVGIEECDNKSEPCKIIGIDLEKNIKPSDKITNIIKGHINPLPYFESKIIETPDGKSVLVVKVFEGNNPPYICDGQIYQRVNEITDKIKPIKDRYSFEKLLDKKHLLTEKIESFMNNQLLIEDSFEQPYLEFYIYVNNPKQSISKNFYSKEFFEEIKENFNSNVDLFDGKLPASIEFDNIHSSVNSYILRHIYNNNPFCTGLTLELFIEGHLKLIFPFNIYDKLSLNTNYETILEYDLLTSNKNNLRIIDLAESILALQIILTQYKRLLKKYDCEYDVYIKSKFKNFKSVTTFVDSMEFMEFIYKNGLPINLKDSIDVPLFGYIKRPFDKFNEFEFVVNIISAGGFPIHLVESISEGFGSLITQKSTKNDKK